MAEVTDALDLGVNLLIALFSDLVVDHITLSSGVFHPTQLFKLPGGAHVEIRAIEVVLAHLVIVVKNCKLIVLFGLKTEFDV